MTDTLTNIEICELLGWKESLSAGIRDFWVLPDGSRIVVTPDFDKLEQPWFDYVIPWLHENKLHYIISSCRGKLASHIMIQDINYSLISSSIDRHPRIAFNKALYQCRIELQHK